MLVASVARPALAEPDQANPTWWILGAGGLVVAEGFEATTYRRHRDQTTGRCNTWDCVFTWWPTESLLAPTSASFLYVWAWQVGDGDGRLDRATGAAVDNHAVMRAAGIAIAGAAAVAKLIIANYALWKALQCSNGNTACAGSTFATPALITLLLTPTMAAGALAGGYGTGYERGKARAFQQALMFQPAVIPGGAMLAFSTTF